MLGVAFRDAMLVGVVVERRRLASPWADEAWTPVAVLPGVPESAPGSVMREGDGWAQLYAGSLPLELFRKETASYKYNLESGAKIWVVLRRSDDGALPWRPHLATVAPDEGQAAMEGGEDIVEAVPMPAAIRDWVVRFIDAHHVDEPFHKRQRKRHEMERPRGEPGR
jgi:hypothetical protein